MRVILKGFPYAALAFIPADFKKYLVKTPLIYIISKSTAAR